MNALRKLSNQGQSIWLDYIQEGFIQSGELQRLVEENEVRGITSNPTIFEKAITGSADYDDALRTILVNDARTNAGKLFESLAIENIRAAPDILRTVYHETEGADGFVSIEVSPRLAHDTARTIDEPGTHWNVTGPQCNDLHKFFEEQYTELTAVIDDTAERARSLGGHWEH